MTTGNKIIIISIAVIVVITLTVLLVCIFSESGEDSLALGETKETTETTKPIQPLEDETLDTTPKPIPELDEDILMYNGFNANLWQYNACANRL